MAFNIFGIDIGSSSLKVVQVEKGFRGFEVIRLARRKISGMDEAAISQALSAVMAELGFDKDEDQVAALYPARNLSSRIMEIPLKLRRQIMEALPYEIESQTPFNVEDFVSDFVTVETNDNGSIIFGVIALKKDLKKFLEIYSNAGIDPDFVVPEPLALATLLPRVEAEGGLVIMIDIGANQTVMTAFRLGGPLSFHVIPRGIDQLCHDANMDGAGMEQALDRRWSQVIEADEWEAPIQNFASALALDAKRLIMSASAKAPDEGEVTILLMGGAGNSIRLAKALAEETGEKVERLKPPTGEASIDDDTLLARKPPSSIFSGALGGALRVAEREKHEQVNLRIGGFEKKRKFAGDQSQAIVAGVLVAVVLLISFLSFIVEGYRMGTQYDSLKSDIRTEFKNAMPEVKRIVAESQQLKNALAKLDEKAKTLGPALLDRDAFLGRLLDISRAAPKDARLDVEELNYEWGQMTISGRTESFEKVEILKNNIAKLPWARSVVVDRAKAAPAAESISFRLEIKTL